MAPFLWLWHTAKSLALPANVSLLFLPPYSPEVDPVERLWQWLRSHRLSNRAFDDYDHLLSGAAAAWDSLDEHTIRSVCACSWADRALQA